MAYQQPYDSYPQSRQLQYYEQWRAQQGQQAQQHHGYYDDYDQPSHQHGYDQHGNGQWDTNYDDQQGRRENGQQHGAYGDANHYAGHVPLSQQRRMPPQDHHHQQPAHDARPQQRPLQQRQDPRQDPRQDSRQRPTGRGNSPPRNAQQSRNGLRPPGLDRSLLNPVRPTNLPQDNPFPTFPAQKSKPAVSTGGMAQSMSQMSLKAEDAHGRAKGPSSRGQLPPPQQQQQHRAPRQERPDGGSRQDSGHFESHGQNKRPSQNRAASDRSLLTMKHQEALGPPRQRGSDHESPQQRAFGSSTQRAVTMPQQLPSEVSREGYSKQQQWTESGTMAGHHGPESPTYIPSRPSAAGGAKGNAIHGHYTQPPSVQQPLEQYQNLGEFRPSPGEGTGALDMFYDDYYEEPKDHQSMISTLDMPNFDAIPETNNKHRRGDSIENHLSPTAAPPHGLGWPAASSYMASVSQNGMPKQIMRSRSQSDLQEGYVNGVYETDINAPPVPGLPRATTEMEYPPNFRNGPQGRKPSGKGNTADAMQAGPAYQSYALQQQPRSNPPYARQPPPVQRFYSDDSVHSEPSSKTLGSFSSQVVTSSPIPRPGTAAPAPGRNPSDPLGRRPGTAQPMAIPAALPGHPNPARPGPTQQGMQQNFSQSPAPQQARPPPIRQYNSEPGRTSLESQPSVAQRQSVMGHPVTHDELNRLRSTLRSNPSNVAIGLKLAKKLVEAASVLSDEGGTADARTKNKNRERFVLEAHKIIKKLVSGGSPDAMFYLADCYGQGLLGLQVDTKEAFNLYQAAAKGGHAASAYRTAVCCEMGHEEGGGTKRDPMKAVQWYRRAAALGDTPALYKMGMVLLKGLLGQQKNFGEAINMLKRAADHADEDNPHALHELALIYEAQSGNERIIRDEAYALELFHQAADLGYKFSQFRLGQAYEYGLLGCQIDARTSIAWYTKAAAQEEHQSELALSGWYLTGTAGILEQSDTEAYLWARKAACAEPPLPKALFAMGYFTEVGIGCPRSLDEAKRWYGRAAAYKFPKAQERLEELKRGGSKVQMKRERLSRTNQKQQEENCVVM